MSTCNRCHGTGTAFNGTCYECNGKGSVNELRYATTKASESKHPAMVAERNHVEQPIVRASELHVKQCMAEMVFADEAILEAEAKPDMHTCQHVFQTNNYFAAQCACGMFEHQFNDGIAIQLEYGNEQV